MISNTRTDILAAAAQREKDSISQLMANKDYIRQLMTNKDTLNKLVSCWHPMPAMVMVLNLLSETQLE